MANLPWSMVSLDLMVGLIPWVSPLFDKMLLLIRGRRRYGKTLRRSIAVCICSVWWPRGITRNCDTYLCTECARESHCGTLADASLSAETRPGNACHIRRRPSM
jgi:hypothetical protein